VHLSGCADQALEFPSSDTDVSQQLTQHATDLSHLVNLAPKRGSRGPPFLGAERRRYTAHAERLSLHFAFLPQQALNLCEHVNQLYGNDIGLSRGFWHVGL
jgi:hypothetical protein